MSAGRDSVVRYDMASIEPAQRVDDGWYGNWPGAVLERYADWKRAGDRRV